MVLPSLNVTCYGKFNTLYVIVEIFLLLSFVKDSSILQFCGDSAQWAGIYHLSGLVDVVVITDSVESSFSVRGFQCLYSERLVFFRGTAMNDY